jgi:hypothetical protein
MPLETAAASAWPHFVPRIELDVHVKDIYGRLDEITQRLATLEGGHREVDLRVAELSDRSQNFATTQALATAVSRLDLDVAICKQELVESREEHRQLLETEAALLRAEAVRDRNPLAEGLETAKRHVSDLEATIQQMADDNEATFVCKSSHFGDCQDLRIAQEDFQTGIVMELDALQSEKATRHELREEHANVKKVRDQLEQGSSTQQERYEKTTALLHEIERRCPSGGKQMAPMAMVQELVELCQGMRQELQKASANHDALCGDLTIVRAKLSETTATRDDQGERLRNFGGELASLRQSLSTLLADATKNAERLEKEIADAKADHMILARKWSEKTHLHSEAFDEVRKLHHALEADLQLLKASQKEESDHVREHSTQRYLEQIDKALGLQKSIKEVERGHLELKEAVAVRLPKV